MTLFKLITLDLITKSDEHISEILLEAELRKKDKIVNQCMKVIQEMERLKKTTEKL